MRKWGNGSFWLMVALAGVAFPFAYQVFFNLFYVAMVSSYGHWKPILTLAILFSVPFYAFATFYAVVPLGLLFGAVGALVSRRTHKLGLWVMRGALGGGLLALFSYLSLGLYFHGWSWQVVFLATLFSGSTAGAMTAVLTSYWRPLPASDNVEISKVSVALVRVPNRGTLLGLAFAFAALGPVFGVLFGMLVRSVTSGAASQGLTDFGLVIIDTLAVGLSLSPFGLVSGLLTGLFSGLVSRGTLSTWRWLAYTAVLGGGLSAISIQTVLVILVFYDSDRGMWSTLAHSLGGMFALGAVSAVACGLVCRGFRPRALLAQSS